MKVTKTRRLLSLIVLAGILFSGSAILASGEKLEEADSPECSTEPVESTNAMEGFLENQEFLKGGGSYNGCAADWNCSYGPDIDCSCPGAGTCTSGSANNGYVDCDCTGAPDTYETCQTPPSCNPPCKFACAPTGGSCVNGECICW